MLSIGKVGLARDQQLYYEQKVARGREDYYAGRGEMPGRWVGDGARQLGLSGEVDCEQLKAMMDGRHPMTSEELTLREPRSKTAAFDLTFSAPKSVSTSPSTGAAPAGPIGRRAPRMQPNPARAAQRHNALELRSRRARTPAPAACPRLPRRAANSAVTSCTRSDSSCAPTTRSHNESMPTPWSPIAHEYPHGPHATRRRFLSNPATPSHHLQPATSLRRAMASPHPEGHRIASALLGCRLTSPR